MFYQCFTTISWVFHHCFTKVIPVFHQCFSSISPVFHQCFTNVLPVFHQCFINVYHLQKLDLNILKIDWAIAILSSKLFVSDFCSKFWEIFLAEKNCDNLGKFKGALKFFFLHDHWWTPLTINCSKIVPRVRKVVQISWK